MTEQTKTDWRTLPAGIDLDRIVAERLGWKNFQNVGGVLFGRLGKPLGATLDYVPNYSTDLNAAFTLPTYDAYYLDLHGPTEDSPSFNAFIQDNDAPPMDECIGRRGEADTPALAVVRAWLSWKAGRR